MKQDNILLSNALVLYQESPAIPQQFVEMHQLAYVGQFFSSNYYSGVNGTSTKTLSWRMIQTFVVEIHHQ